MLLCHLWIWRKNVSNLEVQIVFKISVVFHITLHVRKRPKYIFYTKIHGFRIHSFSLITCIPVCIIINLNFIQFEREIQLPPWLSFLFFTSLPSRSYLCPSQLPKEELSGTKAGFNQWIIESFFSKLTFSFYPVVHFFSLPAISFFFMSWSYGLDSDRTVTALFEVRIC